MAEMKQCPFGNGRCLCQTCKDNAIYDDCESGYCITCIECDERKKQCHDIYVCTGYQQK